jgi:hypothetical protein
MRSGRIETGETEDSGPALAATAIA